MQHPYVLCSFLNLYHLLPILHSSDLTPVIVNNQPAAVTSADIWLYIHVLMISVWLVKIS